MASMKKSKPKPAGGYTVAPGHNVNGKGEGAFIAEGEVDIAEILADAGHLIRVSSDSSGTIQGVNVDASEEDDTTDE